MEQRTFEQRDSTLQGLRHDALHRVARALDCLEKRGSQQEKTRSKVDNCAPNFQSNSCPHAVRLVARTKINKLQLRRGLNVYFLSTTRSSPGQRHPEKRRWHCMEAGPTELRYCAAPRAEKGAPASRTILAFDDRSAGEPLSAANDDKYITDL